MKKLDKLSAEEMRKILEDLVKDAQTIDTNESSVFEDERDMAEYAAREIVETLLDLMREADFRPQHSGCYTCKWCGTGEEINDYGHCWKHNGEVDAPDRKVDRAVGCDEWKARAKRYRIVPAATEIEEIEADSADDALIRFATNMDTDMSAYFKAVEIPCTKE